MGRLGPRRAVRESPCCTAVDLNPLSCARPTPAVAWRAGAFEGLAGPAGAGAGAGPQRGPPGGGLADAFSSGGIMGMGGGGPGGGPGRAGAGGGEGGKTFSGKSYKLSSS
jgi:hypothetical protein